MAEGSYLERLLNDYANPNHIIAQSSTVCPREDSNVFGISPFEDIVSNNHRWNSQEREVEHTGIYELRGINMRNAKMDFEPRKQEGAFMFSQSYGVCKICSGMHPTCNCNFSEQFHYVQNYNRQENNSYFNSYNLGWNNYPTFLWEGQGNQFNSVPPEFQHQGQYQPTPQTKQEQPEAWELALEKFVVAATSRFEEVESAIEQIATTTRNLEIQLGQLINSLNKRADDALPSQTIINLIEHYLEFDEDIEDSTPEVEFHREIDHSPMEENRCIISAPKECAEEVSNVYLSKPIDVYIVYSSTELNEDPENAAVAQELLLTKMLDTSVLVEQEKPDLHNNPPRPSHLNDKLGTGFFSYRKKSRRSLKNQNPKPPCEEGNKKPRVRNRRSYKGNRHRIKLDLVKILRSLHPL